MRSGAKFYILYGEIETISGTGAFLSDGSVGSRRLQSIRRKLGPNIDMTLFLSILQTRSKNRVLLADANPVNGHYSIWHGIGHTAVCATYDNVRHSL